MKLTTKLLRRITSNCLSLLLLVWLTPFLAQAQTVVSDPYNGQPNVSTTKAVVFTFSTAVDPDLTSASFLNQMNPMGGLLAFDAAWSKGNTVLTCTPTPSWPANATIMWFLDGDFTQPPFGTFMTGSGGGGGGTGSGTNAYSSFAVGKAYIYQQSASGAAVTDPDFAYMFQAVTGAASNRVFSSSVVTVPGGRQIGLQQMQLHPELFAFTDTPATSNLLETTYLSGNYTFTVMETTGGNTQTLTKQVNFPSSLAQPNVPVLQNWTAAQSVDASQPFTLTWNASGQATDYIKVDVGSVFSTPELDATNALRGNVTSVTIPAGTLTPGTTNDLTIGFYREIFTTNAAAREVTGVYRGAMTFLELVTKGSGGTGSPTRLENCALVDGKFSFEVVTTPSQVLTVETSPTMQAGSWQTLLTTNAPGSRVKIVDPRAPVNTLFYRVKSGL